MPGPYSWAGPTAGLNSPTIKAVNQMVLTAGILYKNRRLFSFNIDPSYVKNMATNIKDFAKLVRYLSKDDTLSSGILSAFGLDPVSRAALGMNKMASAFDKLASSLNRFSSAIKSVDGQKVNMIRKLTGNIAILSSMDSKMFNNMLTVLEKRSSVFSKLLDSPKGIGGPNVGEKPGGGQREVWSKKTNQGPVDGKGESALQKLDRIAHLLDSINKNVDTVDDLVTHIMNAKKEENLGTEKDDK
jgi:methyl-accepting chemotaxis protein